RAVDTLKLEASTPAALARTMNDYFYEAVRQQRFKDAISTDFRPADAMMTGTALGAGAFAGLRQLHGHDGSQNEDHAGVTNLNARDEAFNFAPGSRVISYPQPQSAAAAQASALAQQGPQLSARIQAQLKGGGWSNLTDALQFAHQHVEYARSTDLAELKAMNGMVAGTLERAVYRNPMVLDQTLPLQTREQLYREVEEDYFKEHIEAIRNTPRDPLSSEEQHQADLNLQLTGVTETREILAQEELKYLADPQKAGILERTLGKARDLGLPMSVPMILARGTNHQKIANMDLTDIRAALTAVFEGDPLTPEQAAQLRSVFQLRG
ncbi:MAG: hypothetical protein WCK08_21070, partial [Betaproteobacteria bacterium]